MNRDERHDRAPETAPRVLDAEHEIVGPHDPESGGTWIAYRPDGYFGAILNGYFEDSDFAPKKANTKSRGDILLHLLGQSDPERAASELDPSQYLSFRLLIGSPKSQILYQWNHETYGTIDFHASHDNRSHLLSSSSWRQDEVINARKRLFSNWAENYTGDFQQIPDFHYASEPTPEAAPLMMRSYSGTKSITTLQISKESISMDYEPIQGAVTTAVEQ